MVRMVSAYGKLIFLVDFRPVTAIRANSLMFYHWERFLVVIDKILKPV